MKTPIINITKLFLNLPENVEWINKSPTSRTIQMRKETASIIMDYTLNLDKTYEVILGRPDETAEK